MFPFRNRLKRKDENAILCFWMCNPTSLTLFAGFHPGFMEPRGMSQQRLCLLYIKHPMKKGLPALRRKCMGSSCKQTQEPTVGAFTPWLQASRLLGNSLQTPCKTVILLPMLWASPWALYFGCLVFSSLKIRWTLCYIVRNNPNFNLKPQQPYHLLILWIALKSSILSSTTDKDHSSWQEPRHWHLV